MGDLAEIEQWVIAQISPRFEEAVTREGFTALVSGADYHGSLIWRAMLFDGLNRYITFSLTHAPPDASQIPDPKLKGLLLEAQRMAALYNVVYEVYAASLSIIVDNNERFLHNGLGETIYLALHSHQLVTPSDILGSMAPVAQIVRSVTEDRFTDRYMVPRSPFAHEPITNSP
jgi:hypothetical protein